MGKHGIASMIGAAMVLSASAADWPQFCGPARDNISTETGLADSWPESGPKVLWEMSVNDGYSSPAIRAGKVYFVDRSEEVSLLRCMDLEKGTELWNVGVEDPGTMSHKQFAGTRGTPAVTDNAAYFVTGWGSLVCVDLATKSVIWKHNLLSEFEMELNRWGLSQSPLLYGDLVIVAITSDRTGVAAYHCKDGSPAWKSESIGGYTFSSPVMYSLCGTDMIVAIGSEAGGRRRRNETPEETPAAPPKSGVFGLSPSDGSVLWHYSGWQCRNAVPFPTRLPDERLFITGGYDAGSAMIRIKKTETGYEAEELFKIDDVSPQIHQPVYLDGHLLVANNGNRKNDGLICVSMDGIVDWRSKDAENGPTFERGGFLLVDGKIVILDAKTGMLHLLRADVSGYKELASAPMVKENDMAWAPLALSDGKLLVRDWTTLKCVDLR
ncbi:MAG: PQQ-binding-like beta-propeller repeat protein [Pontiellaceae bacterium]|nr:PQQ-binding-like beta-propeller repeat protein [Pontiellaceae bacterium]MBN2786078.1 PQQ-binding-like beta-propeller repeat protein [Pontiellaceae bacterium]